MPNFLFRKLLILAGVACVLGAAGPVSAAQSAGGAKAAHFDPSPLVKVRQGGGQYVCCRKGRQTWWMPSRRVCLAREGHVVADRACPERCCVKPGQPPFLTRGGCFGGTFGSLQRCRDSRVRTKTTTRGPGRPPVALCCRKGTRRWKVSSKAACTRQGGRLVSMKLCGDSRVRKKTTTRGVPPRKGKKMEPQGSKGKPASKPAKPGKPSSSHGKPTGIPPGCHRRLTVTRTGTFTKAGGRAQARIAWGAAVRARHGLGYSWLGAQGKKLSCKRHGAVVNCTASAFPCPH